MDLDALLSSIAGRKRRRGGVGFKSAYWRQLERCRQDGHCAAKMFRNAPPPEEYERLAKAAERELVWGDPGQVIEKFGEASSIQTPKALADFDCVVSSFKKDRDGDRLNPNGSTLNASALLWQHIPFEPCGGIVSGGLEGKVVRAHCAIAATDLGEDAVKLIELNALRISHGFQPDEWEPLEDDKGFLISKYEIMEVSLVSIPSNTDAVITAFSRNKLHHPAVKQWAGTKFHKRTKRFNVAIDLALLANGQPIGTVSTDGKAATKSCTCTAEGAGCRTGKTTAAAETKGVQPKRDLPKAPREHAWDAGEAKKRVFEWAAGSWEKYSHAFLITDGPSDEKGSYHFPIADIIDGKLCVVYRACVAAEAALNGARGGTELAGKDRALAVVREYLKEFGDKPAENNDEGKSVTDTNTKGAYCTSAHMDRMKSAHYLVRAAHKHDDLGDEPRGMLNSARGHLDTAIKGIEGSKSATPAEKEKGHQVPSIYLDIIKSAHHMVKSAARHAETGDEPRGLLNDANNHLDTVIKAINAVDEVGREGKSGGEEDETPAGRPVDKSATLPTAENADAALDTAIALAFDGKFADLKKCERLLKSLTHYVTDAKLKHAQAECERLFGKQA